MTYDKNAGDKIFSCYIKCLNNNCRWDEIKGIKKIVTQERKRRTKKRLTADSNKAFLNYSKLRIKRLSALPDKEKYPLLISLYENAKERGIEKKFISILDRESFLLLFH